MRTSLALVHHANQYLITTGYDNREGIEAIIGEHGSQSGLRFVLHLHERYQTPLNLHISGTLLEAIAWHEPAFLEELRHLVATGLIDLIGSCYGQNIMRFFGADYNRRQLNEELLLYKLHLGVDPKNVKTFWPPERVWDTRRMTPVLRDAQLLNDGYKFVILDDRLLLEAGGPRGVYDEKGAWDPDLFRMHEIEEGLGLIAFPIATRLRRSIPPQKDGDWKQVQADLEGLLVHAAGGGDNHLLAIYADDMEKVCGIGEWGGGGPARYEAFLEWLKRNEAWLEPVKMAEWAGRADVSTKRAIERGTFQELAVDFQAGEGYERWYLAPDWAPYRGYFNWADGKVEAAIKENGDAALLDLAGKQLLVANWETAWHTPSTGPHGDPTSNGHASPWARALTSHCRHAAVTAEAACWKNACDGRAHLAVVDIDNDGEGEVVLKNDHLFAVLTPKCGGRIVAMFSLSGEEGAMVIGNPCDDWNWMEELNRYMDVPRNHPGAFADIGFEHEEYAAAPVEGEGDRASVRLTSASGITKIFELQAGSPVLKVRYELPRSIARLSVESGLSPDYLRLLRRGSECLEFVDDGVSRGCRTGAVAVWLKPDLGAVNWETPQQSRFGHGCMFRVASTAPEFTIELGVSVNAASFQVEDSAKQPVRDVA
jgi:hypothetical protein